VADCFGKLAGHAAVPGELRQEREEKRMKKAKRGLALVTSCLVLMLVAACATSRPKLTDKELIDALTQEYLAALQAQDIDKMMAAYSDDFEGENGESKDDIREFLSGAKDQGYLEDIEANMDPCEIKIEGGKATVGPVEYSSALGSLTFEFTMKKDPDGMWRIAEMFAY